MIQPGEYNELNILRFTSVGAYLGETDAHPDDVVLLPNKYLKPGMSEGGTVRVFVYLDSEDRPVATTETPKITLGNFAILKAKDVNRVGAFMDQGLEKDLFVPFSEQAERIYVGAEYLVYMAWDEQTERLYGSCKISRHVERDNIDLKEGQKVEAIVFSETELGFRVLLDMKYEGLLYHNEIYIALEVGDTTTAFVRKVRNDGKVDVRLEQDGVAGIEPNARKVLEVLNKNRGLLKLSDKSSPEEIEEQLQMSKKAFKKAIGNLYKQKLIAIDRKEIRSVVQNFEPEGPKHLRKPEE
ncbi:MAG: GntR family transcriptional regulator [Flavobacteriales bacterium]|nr:GntR family transcriptional regulator [Flavobacteriales bacterium]